MNDQLTRCVWAGRNALQTAYHDAEWGVPVHDDMRFFEFLVLEGAQAGLAWDTILQKRERYRAAFAGFDPQQVACCDSSTVEKLLANAAIVRNRLKIDSAIGNAKLFLGVQAQFGGFDAYIWQFVGGQTHRQSVARHGRSARLHYSFRRHEPRLEQARLQIRRHHDLLCLHAGDGGG